MKQLIIVFASILSIAAYSQNQQLPVRYSFRHGTYLYFADRAISTEAPLQNITAIRISRNTGKNYAVLATISRVGTAEAFKKIAGSAWTQLQIMKGITSDTELWKFITTHPQMNDYGLLSFDMSFRQAMGNGYLDKEAAGLPKGKNWSYKIEWLDATGKIINTQEATVTGGQGAFAFGRARKARSSATDSTVWATWFSRQSNPPNGIVMADVFRQDGGRGTYRKLSTPLLSSQKGDSLLFQLKDDVVPGTLYRYFIIPTDDLGNLSQPSDTISALSFDFSRLPLLAQVKAQDTLNSIRLSWSPLGDLPHVLGVEVQRSRDARGDYVVIDTVRVTNHTFLDTRVFPDVPYFYRLRVIGLKDQEKGTGYSGYATAVVKNKLKTPDPPYGLKGSLVQGKIHLQWQTTNDTDLHGYFVYRAISGSSKFTVISPGLKVTEFTDTAAINGRTQYVYAVKAVNNNSLESEFSNTVTLRQNVQQLPQEPAGLTAYLSNKTVVLDWPSAASADYAVSGYNIYRREAQPKNTYDLKQSAAAQASVLKFTLLNRDLIVQSHFEDTQAAPGKIYEYAIASVDVFGMESTYSPFAKITLEIPMRIVSTCVVRTVRTGVELSWEPEFMKGADKIAIYRKKAGEATYLKAATINPGATTYIDKPARGSLYIYLISAEKGNQAIAKSEEKNIRY
jgi:fibronectin type 3 domain-containing protein